MSADERSSLTKEAKEARLRAFLAARQASTNPTGIPLADRSGSVRTSFGQRRLAFQRELAPEAAGTNLIFAWTLTGALDTGALLRAVELVVERHEALRVRIDMVDGEPRQTIREPYGFPAPVEVAGESQQEREAKAMLLVAEAMRPVMPLSEGRLMRAGLWRTATDRHVFAVAVPHIAFDDWSVGVLLHEIAAGYGAFAAGGVPELPRLRVQYPDYSEWQRATLDQPERLRWVEDWARSMADAPPVLGLPTDRPRPQYTGGPTATADFRLDAGLTAAVERVAAEAAATPFMVCLAAYGLLLSRLANSDDVVIGTPVTNRMLPELEPLIGFFINTLILRVRVDQTLTFRELLSQVKAQVLEMFEHGETPYELLVERLNQVRVPGYNPVVQTMLTQQSGSATPLSLPGIDAVPVPAGDGASEYDLVVALLPQDGQTLGRVFYAQDLFDPETIESWVGRYERLLDACAKQMDEPLYAVDPAGQPTALMSEQPSPGERGVHWALDQVRALAAADPARVAVVAPDGTLTYSEFERRVERLARALGAAAGTEETVGVLLPRSCSLAVTLFAIWRAGAVFVPLDPAHPAERLSGICADAGIGLLITPDGGAPAWWQGPALAPDADGAPVEWHPPHPAALAYLVYTSGTTGTPKGVGVSYGSLSHLANAIAPLAVAESGLMANVLAPSFDGWIWSMVLPLAHGHGVLLADPVDGLEELLTESAACLVTVTPSILGVCERLPDSLHTLVVAGEACPAQLIERWSPGRRFVNAYGPTETTVCATLADSAAGDDTSSIGRPLAGLRTYVVDRYLRRVPTGTTGELVVAGSQVARGYRGQPGLTARRFVPDVGSGDGGRMYRTGDLVRERPDSSLEFVGRLDGQVKIRGFRVEPSEVERAAAKVAGVASAAAVVVDGPHGKTLGLALVASDASQADAVAEHTELELTRRLPSFMVPTAFLTLDALPLTVTGKLDREALSRMCAQQPTIREPSPMSPVEKTIAEIWSVALGVDVAGADTNFFDIGGHSLLAAKLVRELSEALGVKVTVRLLMTRPTVRQLAAEAERLRG
ncbi:amino acid adenylation domain-containing protein [Streptomyces sp. NPDC006530]|uniref:non-ribosomal peptide synthetase n=1 Tax=Streptomyces sp. NPDC006530 TaxID=3364750 RepID=UPI0036BB7F37